MFEVAWIDNYNINSSTTNGYTYASRNLIRELSKTNLMVHTHEDYLDNLNPPKLPEGMGYFIKFDIDFVDVLINNQLPAHFLKPFGYEGVNVGFCYWETTQLPEHFVSELNQMDEVWTTSKWARDVFVDSGVDVPVLDFNLGVDTNTFGLQIDDPDSPFTFMSIGGPSTRKNSQMAVDAFLKLFDGNMNYRLILKSSGPPDARLIYDGHNHGFVGNHPQIEVVDYELSEQELSDFYHQAHCVVYPTSGEGWGMMPFQSIAKGIPTICTDATACTEFANLSMPLDYSWGTDNMSGIYANNGEWAIPDFDDLCDKMLYVAKNHSEVKDFTMQGAWLIRNNYKWSDVAVDYYNAIIDLVY